MKTEFVFFLISGTDAVRNKWRPPTQKEFERLGMEERFKPLGDLVKHYFKDYTYTKVCLLVVDIGYQVNVPSSENYDAVFL